MSRVRGFLRAYLVGEVVERLDNLSRFIFQWRFNMTQQLDNLTKEVGETNTVIQSAIVLITGLKKSLDDAIAANQGGDNGAALDALSASLDTSTNELASAVTANTPAPAPTPPADEPTV